MEPVLTYGVRDTASTVDKRSERDFIEELFAVGVGTLRGALTSDEVGEISERLDAVYRHQCDEVGGEDVLREKINDSDIARCPLAYDAASAFLALAQQPRMTEIAKAVLGDSVVLIMQNGIHNHPAKPQFQTRWHRDLNYQHWVADGRWQ